MRSVLGTESREFDPPQLDCGYSSKEEHQFVELKMRYRDPLVTPFRSSMAYTGEQKREYQRRWLQARREKAIEYLGSSCASCGSSDKLEFDHKVRELKAANIATLLSRKWEVLKAELDKCQLLCNDCHLSKTVSEVPIVHGDSRYIKHGCRCEVCKTEHSMARLKYENKRNMLV